MLELRSVRQFVAVAEELSFRRAAERLHMSQPPLSVAMQNLEAQIGTRLLDRSKHHVRLTPAGQVFYQDAVQLLQLSQQAEDRARRTGEGREGSIRLSFVPSAALDLLPAILKQFQTAHPTVEFKLTAENTRRQLEALSRNHVDLALVVGPVHHYSGIELVALKSQEFVIAVPSSHLLAARTAIDIHELADQPFVSFSATEGAGFVNALMTTCHAAGFLPNVVHEASQMQSILTLVAGGLGVALVPASLKRLQMEGVAFLEVLDSPRTPEYDLVFAYNKLNDNPVLEAFISMAIDVVGRPDQAPDSSA